ncbi:MAG: methyltransferase domain-containing protein [Sulfurimonas sp.]|jgi:ubiquinone/menaquinone biosynthesis C-methylase UbiE
MQKKIFFDPIKKRALSFKEINTSEGICNLFFGKELKEITKEQKEYYDKNAQIYDDVAHLTFDIQNENEQKIRDDFITWLNLESNHTVLDLSCGTGKDSVGIAQKLKNGSLYCADISKEMLKKCKEKVDRYDIDVTYCLANAEHLPFKDNSFDRLISFGGLNVFGDIEQALQEMARVVKPGGKVLVGDESMPPWLYDTEFGKILLNNNPLFTFEIPLKEIPVEARNVIVRWIIGGVYYMIEFDVGEGEPQGNFDLLIPGTRGGTLNTRYYGKLEGVTKELKSMVIKQAQNEDKSIHQWLNENLSKILEIK